MSATDSVKRGAARMCKPRPYFFVPRMKKAAPREAAPPSKIQISRTENYLRRIPSKAKPLRASMPRVAGSGTGANDGTVVTVPLITEAMSTR